MSGATSSAMEEARRLLEQRDLAERCRGVERLAELDGREVTWELANLLEESSWYLRERVVEALGGRPDTTEAVARVLREGTWFARASACDVVSRSRDLAAAPDLIPQVEDRNVSLQKSAVGALRRLAEKHGTMGLAGLIAALPAERRRRVTARIGHQEPRWALELERAMAGIPVSRFGASEGGTHRVASPVPAERSLVRFRRWLARLSTERTA